jgi:chromosome transmission fidelity protein 4
MYDSTGLLSILDRHRRHSQARWVPFHDSSSLKDKSYWPVGLTETHFTCVILRGKEREPWFPRPLIQEIELGIPLVGMEHEQGKREEA